MHIRLYFKHNGGRHVHCRLFTAERKDRTHVKCGDLVFDEREWLSVRSAFEQIAEVLHED